MQNITNLRKEIRTIKPGFWLNLGTENDTTYTVERSGNGKEIRFVRTEANGSFKVFKTMVFAEL